MSLLPQSLWARLAIALLVALVGVAWLHRAVSAGERVVPGARPIRFLPQPSVAPSPLASLGFPLSPVAGRVVLASRLEAIPPSVAPVLQVFLDGSLAVRRPPRLASGPLPRSRPDGSGDGAALILPRSALVDWGPAARSVTVEVLARWLADRPVATERIRVADLALASPEIRSLLAWVP